MSIEIMHIAEVKEDFSLVIPEVNDRFDYIVESMNKIIEERNSKDNNKLIEYPIAHPLKGKTTLPIRAKYLQLGSVTNIDTIPNSTLFENGADDLLYYKYRGGSIVAIPGAGGGGEANTASSQGSGTSLFYQKSASDLQFNAIKSENSRITVALDAGSHDVELTLNEGSIVHQNLSGAGSNAHSVIDSHIGDSILHFTEESISIPASQISDFDTEVSNNPSVSDNATHSGLTSGNPHLVTLSDVGGTTNHIALSNIGTNTHAEIDTHIADTNDDHTQYHNNTRGDARYLQLVGGTMVGDIVMNSNSVTGPSSSSFTLGNVTDITSGQVMNLSCSQGTTIDFTNKVTITSATNNIVLSGVDILLQATGTIYSYRDINMGGHDITTVGTVDGIDIATDVAANTSHRGDSSLHFTEASIDHGSIDGLTDDDHTQYYNETRGDARYLGLTAKASDSDKLDNLDSTQFARTDIDETFDEDVLFSKELQIKSSNSTPQFIIERDLVAQGLTITAGGGNTVYNSYEGTDVIYGRHIFNSTKGSTTVERMRIDNSGNVGIGTDSPSSKLSVVGLPTSASGLSSGDIWRNGTVLNIVA